MWNKATKAKCSVEQHHKYTVGGFWNDCFCWYRCGKGYVCLWDPTFSTYLAKKRAEGKHYNVAISHAAKKLVRLIFAMEKSRQPYRSVT